MAEDQGASRREEELRQHVAVLKQELEQERNAKKQLHRDQVPHRRMLVMLTCLQGFTSLSDLAVAGA